MKRLVCFLAVLFFLTGAVTAGSPWFDPLLDGVYLNGYDGFVRYDLDVIEAPISVAEPTGWSLGHVYGDGDSLTFTDWYGVEYTGTFHEDTGCYLDWSGDMPDTIVALCYGGGRSLDLFYATIRWDGSAGVLTGPWFFHIYAEAVVFPQKNSTVAVE